MEINKLGINGLLMIKNDPFLDNRGSFEANWDSNWLQQSGLSFQPQNACHSYNLKANTLRGMHYQQEPYGQAKWVSCISGSVFDVVVDLRPSSSTYLQWEAVTLEGGSGISIYIPSGCAHGFLTLQDHTTISYLIEGEYMPTSAAALRWNDAAVNIKWPVKEEVLIISDKDKNLPAFIV